MSSWFQNTVTGAIFELPDAQAETIRKDTYGQYPLVEIPAPAQNAPEPSDAPETGDPSEDTGSGNSEAQEPVQEPSEASETPAQTAQNATGRSKGNKGNK